MKLQNKNTFVFLLVLLIGLVIGGVLGTTFKHTLPVLAYGQSIGVDTFVVDLSILKVTLGLKMQINVAGIIGLALAMIVYKKL